MVTTHPKRALVGHCPTSLQSHYGTPGTRILESFTGRPFPHRVNLFHAGGHFDGIPELRNNLLMQYNIRLLYSWQTAAMAKHTMKKVTYA